MSDCIRFPRLKAEPCDVEASFCSRVSDWADDRGCCTRSTLPRIASTSMPCKHPFTEVNMCSSGPIMLRVLLTVSIVRICALV